MISTPRIFAAMVWSALVMSMTSSSLPAADETGDPPELPVAEAPGGSRPDGRPDASLSLPTAQHEVLVYFLGQWETTTRFATPSETELDLPTGESTFRFVLGRHYLLETFQGSLDDRPYEELGLLGFDPLRKEFVATWMNNAELRPMRASGIFDQDARIFVLHGSRDDLASGTSRMHKYVLRVLGPDEFLFQMLDPGGDEDRLLTEMRYRRIHREPATTSEEP